MSTETGEKSARSHKLGWALVFAVVYADIGTSIFYVPAILYLSIGNLATLAQIITTGVFISIARKYVEICERCPDGGGVVSIVRQAFSSWPWLPLVGGSFITVDYFLTSAISGISGVYYLATLMPGAKEFVIPFTGALFVALTVLNIVGIKESAQVTSWFSALKILVTFLLLGASAVWLSRNGAWSMLFGQVFHPGVELSATVLMIGYADTWLAYSGLESAAQVSGSMEAPVSRTASKAMWLVIIAIAVFSPPITAAAIYILPDHVKHGDPESLMSALAFMTGGSPLGILTVISASTLLFMACNTAIVGNYHVNVRLADLGFCPAFLRRRHPRFGTPHISIVLSAAIPMLVILFTRGSISALGDLYAFGLLGTLTLSSAAVDRLRWRDGIRGWKFWGGLFTTVAVTAAWLINMVHKPEALLFGGILAAIMVFLGLRHHIEAEREATKSFSMAETAAADSPEASTVLTLEEAIEAGAIESADVMISIRYVNARLLEASALQVKGAGRTNAYVIYVDEAPGLFLAPETKPTPDALRILGEACALLGEYHITGIPIWRIAEDAGSAVAEAATKLKVKNVFVGSSKRNFFWRMLRGRILKKLANSLPEECSLQIIG